MLRQLPACLLGCALAAQWAPITTTAAPPAQQYPVMAFDLAHGETLLHGAAGATSETWGYAGGVWTRKSPAILPPQRSQPGMVFDVAAGRAILYGGHGSSATPQPSLDDTWAFDGTNWTLLQPAATPGGRAKFGMAYDLGRMRTVLYGGTPNVFQPTLAADTWEFDGATWTQVASPGTSTAGARERMAMCYMTSRQRTVLFGGQDTTLVAPTYDDTWTWDGVQWTQVQVAGPHPAARVDAQLADDPLRGVVVLCGGMDPVSMTIFNDTWEFDGTSWRETGARLSPPRSAFGMAFDLQRGRIVLFGGRTASLELRDDTWEYGASWRSYGNGCQGSAGVPVLTGVQAPRLGGVAQSRLTNLLPAAPAAILAIGTSRTSWQFGSLPASLAQFGMPGCVAYASAELFVVLPASGGAATWTWQVPAAPRLFGLSFYQQGLSLDPAANPAGIVASNAATGTLGW
jgi:hypothetical protein